MKSWTILKTAAAIAIPALVLVGCDKSDPTAPDQSKVLLSANPTRLNLDPGETGSSNLLATVDDAEGRPVTGINVRFSTNSGILRSGGDGVRTDSNGIARDIITLTGDDEDAAVVARASGATEATVTVLVSATSNAAPVAVASSSASTVKTGQSVTFNGSNSSDSDGTVTNWKWTFNFPLVGGGSQTDIVQGNAATAEIVTKTFPAEGAVITTLQVTDNIGLNSAIVTLTPALTVVNNFAPTAVIQGGARTVSVNAPFQVSGFGSTDDSRDVGGTIVRYDWSWGDGTASDSGASSTATHTYTSQGGKTLTLVVWDNGDGTLCDPNTLLCHNSKSGTTSVTVTVGP